MAIADEIGIDCPHCGGQLLETLSTTIGFCPKCSRHVKILKENIIVKKRYVVYLQ